MKNNNINNGAADELNNPYFKAYPYNYPYHYQQSDFQNQQNQQFSSFQELNNTNITSSDSINEIKELSPSSFSNNNKDNNSNITKSNNDIISNLNAPLDIPVSSSTRTPNKERDSKVNALLALLRAGPAPVPLSNVLNREIKSNNTDIKEISSANIIHSSVAFSASSSSSSFLLSPTSQSVPIINSENEFNIGGESINQSNKSLFENNNQDCRINTNQDEINIASTPCNNHIRDDYYDNTIHNEIDMHHNLNNNDEYMKSSNEMYIQQQRNSPNGQEITTNNGTFMKFSPSTQEEYFDQSTMPYDPSTLPYNHSTLQYDQSALPYDINNENNSIYDIDSMNMSVEMDYCDVNEHINNNNNSFDQVHIEPDPNIGLSDNQIPFKQPVIIVSHPNTKDSLYRQTKNQQGKLEISKITVNKNYEFETKEIPFNKPGCSVRPGTLINVIWQLPLQIYREYSDLVIGLCRYASTSNYPCIIAKYIGRLQFSGNKVDRTETVDEFGNPVVTGSIQFHSPKSAGSFVFRIFEHSTVNTTSTITFGTSYQFYSDLYNSEVSKVLGFCLENLLGSVNIHKGVSQLHSTIISMKKVTSIILGSNSKSLLELCIQSILEVITNSIIILGLFNNGLGIETVFNLFFEIVQVKSCSPTNSIVLICRNKFGKFESENEIMHSLTRIHRESHSLLNSLIINDIIWSTLHPELKQEIIQLNEFFCPLLGRFFKSIKDRESARFSCLGFVPSFEKEKATTNNNDSNNNDSTNFASSLISKKKALDSLDGLIASFLVEIIPKKEFYNERELFRLRLENLLKSSGVFIVNIDLILFGSSVNNFGMQYSDVDICVMIPLGWDFPIEERITIIIRIAEMLAVNGMDAVRIRAAKRHPLLQFVDPSTGYICDMTLNNPFCIKNSTLLHTYSEIDPRVRTLVYIIRYWTSSRNVNKTNEGTLNNYAFILTIIYFLQNRPVPLLPNLQRIPEDWTGGGIPIYKFPSDNEDNNDDPIPMKDSDYIIHPLDQIPCDCYFYQPKTQEQKDYLSNFASKNKETVAELLVEYFHFFGWEFNYYKNYISIKSHKKVLMKIDKVESDGWTNSDAIAIEDPFEDWYNVAHSLKQPQMSLIRREFIRAYTVIARSYQDENIIDKDIDNIEIDSKSLLSDSLPSVIKVPHIIEILCQLSGSNKESKEDGIEKEIKLPQNNDLR
jgi:DNA polymerase sigma